MAHYALLDENNIVTFVFPGKDEDSSIDWEEYYSNETGQRCLRTSYNTHRGIHSDGGEPFRYNYAGQGMLYIEELDSFVYDKLFKTWTFDASSMRWVPPIEKPEDVKEMRSFDVTLPTGETRVLSREVVTLGYYWDEEAESWGSFTEEELSNQENAALYAKTIRALSIS